jgi:hypothetical protein
MLYLPKDQISALWSYGFSSINSGAMYSGVPYKNRNKKSTNDL